MCYVHNQWYNISCATLYFDFTVSELLITALNNLQKIRKAPTKHSTTKN